MTKYKQKFHTTYIAILDCIDSVLNCYYLLEWQINISQNTHYNLYQLTPDAIEHIKMHCKLLRIIKISDNYEFIAKVIFTTNNTNKVFKAFSLHKTVKTYLKTESFLHGWATHVQYHNGLLLDFSNSQNINAETMPAFALKNITMPDNATTIDINDGNLALVQFIRKKSQNNMSNEFVNEYNVGSSLELPPSYFGVEHIAIAIQHLVSHMCVMSHIENIKYWIAAIAISETHSLLVIGYSNLLLHNIMINNGDIANYINNLSIFASTNVNNTSKLSKLSIIFFIFYSLKIYLTYFAQININVNFVHISNQQLSEFIINQSHYKYYKKYKNYNYYEENDTENIARFWATFHSHNKWPNNYLYYCFLESKIKHINVEAIMASPLLLIFIYIITMDIFTPCIFRNLSETWKYYNFASFTKISQLANHTITQFSTQYIHSSLKHISHNKFLIEKLSDFIYYETWSRIQTRRILYIIIRDYWLVLVTCMLLIIIVMFWQLFCGYQNISYIQTKLLQMEEHKQLIRNQFKSQLQQYNLSCDNTEDVVSFLSSFWDYSYLTDILHIIKNALIKQFSYKDGVVTINFISLTPEIKQELLQMNKNLYDISLLGNVAKIIIKSAI